MIVIGERINASNRSVGAAIAERDAGFIANLAAAQAAAGADFIDVNTGAGQLGEEQEKEAITWLVDTIQAATDRPLAFDSDRPGTILAAVRAYRGSRMVINSVTAEPARLAAIGPIVAEHGAQLVALTMGADGIPQTVEQRLEACNLIVAHLAGLGVKEDQLLFDPLVLPIAVDTGRGVVTMKAIGAIKARYPGSRTVVGLSNISYGLPRRKVVNRGFLLMAAYAGLDAAILDPLDERTMSLVKVADLLTGNDAACRGYLRAHRRNRIVG